MGIQKFGERRKDSRTTKMKGQQERQGNGRRKNGIKKLLSQRRVKNLFIFIAIDFFLGARRRRWKAKSLHEITFSFQKSQFPTRLARSPIEAQTQVWELSLWKSLSRVELVQEAVDFFLISIFKRQKSKDSRICAFTSERRAQVRGEEIDESEQKLK